MSVFKLLIGVAKEEFKAVMAHETHERRGGEKDAIFC